MNERVKTQKLQGKKKVYINVLALNLIVAIATTSREASEGISEHYMELEI